MAADGDFFAVLRDGRASIVTAAIDRFTPGGVRLEDGSELAADIIVTATGLRMMMLGGLELEVDGTPVDLGSTIAYKGMMLGGVPEPRLHGRLHQRILDAEGRPGGRLRVPAAVAHAREREARSAYRAAPARASPPTRSSTSNPATCCARPTHLPKQAGTLPWRLHQNYIRDIRMLRHGPIDDEMDFPLPAGSARRPAPARLGGNGGLVVSDGRRARRRGLAGDRGGQPGGRDAAARSTTARTSRTRSGDGSGR